MIRDLSSVFKKMSVVKVFVDINGNDVILYSFFAFLQKSWRFLATIEPILLRFKEYSTRFFETSEGSVGFSIWGLFTFIFICITSYIHTLWWILLNSFRTLFRLWTLVNDHFEALTDFAMYLNIFQYYPEFLRGKTLFLRELHEMRTWLSVVDMYGLSFIRFQLLFRTEIWVAINLIIIYLFVCLQNVSWESIKICKAAAIRDYYERYNKIGEYTPGRRRFIWDASTNSTLNPAWKWRVHGALPSFWNSLGFFEHFSGIFSRFLQIFLDTVNSLVQCLFSSSSSYSFSMCISVGYNRDNSNGIQFISSWRSFIRELCKRLKWSFRLIDFTVGFLKNKVYSTY